MKRLTLLSACILLGINLFGQQKVTWKKIATGYYVYIDNKPQNNTISTLFDDDLLVYDSVSTATVVLNNYRNAQYDTENTGQYIGRGNDTYYFRNKDKLYWVYKMGTRVMTTRAVWADENMIVYDTVNRQTLLFRNFLNATNNAIYPAESLGNSTTEFWRKKGESYWFYSKGNYVGTTTSFWLGDHLVIYDTIGNRSFQFSNYKAAEPGKIYPATEIKTVDHIFFWQKNGSYWLYDKGKSISGGKSYWHDNDLVVYHEATNRTYLLPNYINLTEFKLNPAQVLSTTQHIWWFGDENNYWLYDMGAQVMESGFKKDGNNLIVNGSNGKTYIINDFYIQKDMALRPAYVKN